jgi:hypothetical protein
VSTTIVRLIGNITEISRAGLYSDRQERVTVSVEGAEPLYAELRLPNKQGWAVGQRVMVTIVPTATHQVWAGIPSPDPANLVQREPHS